MTDLESAHLRTAKLSRFLGENERPERKAELDPPEEVRVERLLGRAQPLVERRWTPHDQLALSAGEMLLEHQKGDPAEVIAMEMRHRDRVDARGIDVLLDGGQRRAAAIQQQRDARCGDVDGGVRPPTVAERVAAPKESDHDGHAISLKATGRRSLSDRGSAGRRSATAYVATRNHFPYCGKPSVAPVA